MIQGVFAVYDLKLRAYMTPFFMSNREVAVRAFATAVNEQGTQLHAHPSDFTLFQLGSFNDELGVIEMLQEHVNLGLAAHYRGRQDNGADAS